MPKDYVTAEEFASDLLGFEEYEEGDEADDLATGAANAALNDPALNPGAGVTGVPEVIPEEPGY